MAGEWQQFTLGDLCKLITDGKHGDCENEADSGFYFLSVKDVLDNRLVYENARQITEADFLETHRRTSLEPGDVLFTNTGTIGRMAIAPDHPRTCQTTFQKSVAILKPRRNLVEPHFLYYLLHFDNARLSDFAAGTTQKNLLLKDLRSFTVRIPPLPEQRAIAHILGTLDDKIELNRGMNGTLEGMARALFQSWFVDFDPVRAKAEGRAPNLPKPIANLFPDSFQDSELGEIPKGWKVETLGNLIEMVKGRSYKSEELVESDTALVTLKSFARGGGYRPDGLKSFAGTYKPEQVVKPGELVIACTDVTQAAEVIGRPAIVRGMGNFQVLVASLDTLIVRPSSSGMTRAFLYFLGGTGAFIAHTYAHTSGTTVLHLAKEAVPSFMFPCPSTQLIEKFDSMASIVLNRIQGIEEESSTLSSLRDALLPKLISGELRVGDAAGFLRRAGI